MKVHLALVVLRVVAGQNIYVAPAPPAAAAPRTTATTPITTKPYVVTTPSKFSSSSTVAANVVPVVSGGGDCQEDPDDDLLEECLIEPATSSSQNTPSLSKSSAGITQLSTETAKTSGTPANQVPGTIVTPSMTVPFSAGSVGTTSGAVTEVNAKTTSNFVPGQVVSKAADGNRLFGVTVAALLLLI
ncbi:hypothetical protein BJ741DRAFT_652190 [Chytriomyces cf. hyalinus JEL632]|nr:hypothetical protein BJ741DRAFT_652190 [Chytriomyces cf. hyalinus JEL632]